MTVELLRGRSPLKYNHGHDVVRIAVRDSSAPPSTGQRYFADTVRTIRTGAGGRELKVPRKENLPGTGDPQIVAFLDYHYVPYAPQPIPTIDFATTREDMRRRGYTRQLLDTFLLEHADAPWIEFGDVLHSDMWNYLQRRQAEGWKVHGKLR